MTLVAMKMTDQTRKAEHFRALHVPGKPLVLFNIWDAGIIFPGGRESLASEEITAGVVGDGERMAVLTIAEQELPLVIGAPQFVGPLA